MSGWMEPETFLLFMKHFVKTVKVNIEHPVLLLLDNPYSHLAIDVLDYCKDNGVVLLSFPPHCSHKLQPLDRTVFGPLKKIWGSEQQTGMRNNPGKTMTITYYYYTTRNFKKDMATISNFGKDHKRA